MDRCRAALSNSPTRVKASMHLRGVWLWHTLHRTWACGPQSAKTESTLFPTDAVVRLGCVVPVNEVLHGTHKEFSASMRDHHSTYIGRKTTTLWTFQDCVQGTPEAGIRLQKYRSTCTRVSPEAYLPP